MSCDPRGLTQKELREIQEGASSELAVRAKERDELMSKLESMTKNRDIQKDAANVLSRQVYRLSDELGIVNLQNHDLVEAVRELLRVKVCGSAEEALAREKVKALLPPLAEKRHCACWMSDNTGPGGVCRTCGLMPDMKARLAEMRLKARWCPRCGNARRMEDTCVVCGGKTQEAPTAGPMEEA